MPKQTCSSLLALAVAIINKRRKRSQFPFLLLHTLVVVVVVVIVVAKVAAGCFGGDVVCASTDRQQRQQQQERREASHFIWESHTRINMAEVTLGLPSCSANAKPSLKPPPVRATPRPAAVPTSVPGAPAVRTAVPISMPGGAPKPPGRLPSLKSGGGASASPAGPRPPVVTSTPTSSPSSSSSSALASVAVKSESFSAPPVVRFVHPVGCGALTCLSVFSCKERQFLSARMLARCSRSLLDRHRATPASPSLHQPSRPSAARKSSQPRTPCFFFFCRV